MKFDYTTVTPYDDTKYKFGTITMDDGRLIYLTQQAYLTGSSEAPRYEASATDAKGNDYMVVWVPYDNYQEIMTEDDESGCCDWGKFEVRPL